MSKYSTIINKLFEENKKFELEDFYDFVGEITKKRPSLSDCKKSKSIDQEGNEYVREEIAIFEDINSDKLAIMTYKMPSKTKVEKARSEQRNLISTYLRNEGVFQGINSVLVAFYSDDSRDWRLSFIKQEFKLSQTELDSKGRPKIVNELTPAKRYSFLVESNSKNLTVKQRLDDLISGRVLISDIEKAFSVEKVSKEFFEKYVVLYRRLCGAFENDLVFKKVEEEHNNGDEHFRENFVKKLLGQIVFLYFLQKKGWLGVKQGDKWGDGDKNFLQNLLGECLNGGDPKKELQGKNFLNDYLEHLFYDNLNLKREGDYSEYFGYRIPYLNGGLFEPINGYDWKKASNILLAGDENNTIFKDIFATFDEYNFTVYENDPLEQDVAVDPEMLGKVFENLLPENERKGKGAFYTPREIVHYMCKESLKNHLMNKTGISEQKINGLFERKDSMLNLKKFGEKMSDDERYAQFGEYIDYAGKIVESLKTIKIVDPAVGSGAFPMGLLKEIVSLRKYLQESILLEDNVSEYVIKKETLENCIYGVDLDPGAVEIAKLRFWLSLVIEEESKESIDPLPNLDYKIMQGNSLIEDIVIGETVIKLDIENNSKKLTKKEQNTIGGASQIGLGIFTDEQEVENTLKNLKNLHKAFFLEKDGTKKKVFKGKIDHIEKELIRISGEVEVGKLKARIESIEGKYLLSGAEQETKDSNEIKRLTSQIQSIKEMEEKYRKDNIRTFFPWKLHFGEVFNENGGFDIVIGNPPYVGEKGNKEIFELIRKGNLGKFSQGKMDLFYYFFHLGLNLTKEGSQVCFITTNYYITADGGVKLRKDISERSLIKKLVNLNELKIFESAKGQHNIISFLEKGNNKDSLSKNLITKKTGYYLDGNNQNVLNDIFNGSNKDTQYFSIKQKDLFDGVGFYIRLGGASSDNGVSNNILNKISSGSVLLGSIADINKGFHSGCDKVTDGNLGKISINEDPFQKGEGIFVLSEEEAQLKSILGERIIHKCYKNSDIKKWYTNINSWKGLYVVYTNKFTKIEDFPFTKRHLERYRPFLEMKREFKNGLLPWFSQHWARNEDIFVRKDKIILPYRSKENIFSFCDYDFYASEDVLYIYTINDNFETKYILSLLNSSLYFYWLYNKGKKKGEVLELYGQPLSEIPIREISKKDQIIFTCLVDEINNITSNEYFFESKELQAQIKILESKINGMVYELYGLTPDEIKIVEESVKK